MNRQQRPIIDRELKARLAAGAVDRGVMAKALDAFNKLFKDLAQHVRIEEAVRFPMFEAQPAS